jgi:hypothetical protein
MIKRLPWFASIIKTDKDGIIDETGFDTDEYFRLYFGLSQAADLKIKRVGINKQKRQDILNKRGNQCALCSKKQDLQIHHLDEDPSNNEMYNLQLLCYTCHHKMGYKKIWKINKKKNL